MNKQQGQLFIWIGGSLILGLITLGLLSPPENDEQKKWRRLTSISKQEVQNIVIKDGGTANTISVVEQNYNWVEKQAPLNVPKLDSFLNELLSTKCGGQLTGNLEEYGLNPVKWDITINTGESQIGLQIGDKTTLSNHHYVICDEMDGPRLSQYSLSVPDSFEEFIDTRLFSFNPDLIDSINLNNGQKMELIDGVWGFTHPQSVVADNKKVIEWLESLTDLKGKQWVMNNSTDHKGQISLHASGIDYIYNIGVDYVTTNRNDQFTVDESTIEHISLSPESFYSTSLITNENLPVKVELEIGGLFTTSQLNDSKWDDSGVLWTSLSSLKFIRVAESKLEKVGSLKLDYGNGLIKQWTISKTDTHYQLDGLEETVLLKVTHEDLDGLLLAVEE